MTPAPNQSDIQSVLRAFLLAVLPDGDEVYEGDDNKVPEARVDNHVVMTTIRRPRLATNIDDSADVLFTASMAGTSMIVTAVAYGTIEIGAIVFSPHVAALTKVLAGPGGGGVGTSTIDPAQTVASEAMAAGQTDVMQKTEVVVQLDVYGKTPKAASDRAQTISTLLRDEYAANFFYELNPDIAPLYASDPQQLSFVNAENQYETRWIVEAVLQANQTVVVPQQYAGAASVVLVSVEADYPA